MIDLKPGALLINKDFGLILVIAIYDNRSSKINEKRFSFISLFDPFKTGKLFNNWNVASDETMEEYGFKALNETT